MKIFKMLVIFMLATFLTLFMTGCLDFAQQRNKFEEQPLKTTYDGGSKTTIVIQGIPAEKARGILKDILKQIEEQENIEEDD